MVSNYTCTPSIHHYYLLSNHSIFIYTRFGKESLQTPGYRWHLTALGGYKYTLHCFAINVHRSSVL
jgi:hypothetical protein